MGEMLFFLILSGAGAVAFSLAYLLFEIMLFIIYKLDGGRLGLISYFKKL